MDWDQTSDDALASSSKTKATLDQAFAMMLSPLVQEQKETLLLLTEQVRRLADNVARLVESREVSKSHDASSATWPSATSPAAARGQEPHCDPPAALADPDWRDEACVPLAAPWGETLRPTGDAPVGAGDAWERILLGDALCDDSGLGRASGELFADIRHGATGAKSLLAQIMLAPHAAKEQLPRLLKEVGEAYYAWRPKTSSHAEPWERALVAWLTRLVEDAGLHNSIELVHVGDRFDPSRHTASERGTDVTVVRGWLVAKERGGKTLHRALVSVK